MRSGVAARRRSLRRIGLAASLAATLAASGCAAGQYAQSATEQESLDGTTVRLGTTITLGGLSVQTPSDGISWASGSRVPLNVVIVNSGQKDDQLTSITSPSITGWSAFASDVAASAQVPGGSSSGGSGTASASSPAGASGGGSNAAPVPLAAHSGVRFGGSGNRVLLLTGVKSALSPGMAVTLTFTFARAGSVTARVPVQITKSAQTSVIPGPSATGEQG